MASAIGSSNTMFDHQQDRQAMLELQQRNKYNTWTHAEAKRLNKYLAAQQSTTNNNSTACSNDQREPPARTASVRHKPRPPLMTMLSTDGSDFLNSLSTSPPCPRGDSIQSVNKPSLTSSTYRVFQAPLANFKRFFNSMPRPFSTPSSHNHNHNNMSNTSSPNSNDFSQVSLGDSISRLCLNRSQSPPTCSPPPPPPCELKSMSYLESSVNYSNYDEFLSSRSKNEHLGNMIRSSLTSNGHEMNGQHQFQSSGASTLSRVSSAVHSRSKDLNGINSSHYTGPQKSCDQDISDSDSWHLASLPIAFERNLTTVFEGQCNGLMNGSNDRVKKNIASVRRGESIKQLVPVPPPNVPDNVSKGFDQCDDGLPLHAPRSTSVHVYENSDNHFSDQQRQLVVSRNLASSKNSTSNSSQSLASITTTDSVLDYHRQTATAYRFSFAQPQIPRSATVKVCLEPKNDCYLNLTHDNSTNSNMIDNLLYSNQASIQNGLPPRAPSHQHPMVNCAKNTSEQKNDTSSGNSSNSSSQLNGLNLCGTNTNVNQQQQQRTSSDECEKSSVSDYATTYGNLNGLDNDIDTTIISESSTICAAAGGGNAGGGNARSTLSNRCAELERHVESLKRKLMMKEKILTDTQLRLVDKDYRISELEVQVSKLDKENAHLKSLVFRFNSNSSSNYRVPHMSTKVRMS